MTSPAIEVRGLRKVYEPPPRWMTLLLREPSREPVTALDGIDLTVNPGEIRVVAGPNGAGKSTLFRILTGLTGASAGEATMLGRDVTEPTPGARALFGYMPTDDRSLYLRQTCRQNLALNGRLHGLRGPALDRRIDEVLELVDLAHARDRSAYALSSGMRARLMFARAIIHLPPVLILDEPTGETDPIAAQRLLTTIRTTATEIGAAVLLSSHRLEEIEALGEHVILLDAGRIVHDGDLAALGRTMTTPSLEITFASASAAASAADLLGRTTGVEVLDVDGPVVRCASEASTGQVLASLNGQLRRVVRVSEHVLPLREVMARMYARGTR